MYTRRDMSELTIIVEEGTAGPVNYCAVTSTGARRVTNEDRYALYRYGEPTQVQIFINREGCPRGLIFWFFASLFSRISICKIANRFIEKSAHHVSPGRSSCCRP